MGRDVEARLARLEARLLAPREARRLAIMAWADADTIVVNGEPVARMPGETDSELERRAIGPAPLDGMMLVIGPTRGPSLLEGRGQHGEVTANVEVESHER